jgi:hypothetical protein
MSASAILALLGTSIGPHLAKGVLEKLLTAKGSRTKMQRAFDATEKGVSIISALKGEFGDQFLNALGDIRSKQQSMLSYEAGTSNYIKLEDERFVQNSIGLLRDELNINLDMLVGMDSNNPDQLKNYFIGTFSVWKSRYEKFLHVDADAKSTFSAIDELMSNDGKTFKDVLDILARTSLGGTGALMVIMGVLLATSTGVGLATAISTYIFGIPWLSVGILVIPGAILAALSRYKLRENHAMSTAVKMAYQLLERHHKHKPQSITS